MVPDSLVLVSMLSLAMHSCAPSKDTPHVDTQVACLPWQILVLFQVQQRP